MTNRAIAARYAKALLDVSLKEGDPRTTETDLAAFVALMKTHQELAQVLTHPAVPVHKKEGVTNALSARGRLAPVVTRTLALLASRDRLGVLPDLLAAYRERLLDREGVVRAEIATAAAVAPDRLQSIERGLAVTTGRRVMIETRLEPSMIGGVVARIGSTVYDGSVATQLRKVKETITGAGWQRATSNEQ